MYVVKRFRTRVLIFLATDSVFHDNSADFVWQGLKNGQPVQLPPHLHGFLADLFPLFQDHTVPSVILVCGGHVEEINLCPNFDDVKRSLTSNDRLDHEFEASEKAC